MVDDVPDSAPALWNPLAVGLWSILFSPVFGTLLQRRNWLELGEARAARSSLLWCWASVVVTVANTVAALALPQAHVYQEVADYVWYALVLVWYVFDGRKQRAFVQARLGGDYPRKSWALPLFVGFLGVVVLLVAFTVIALLLQAPP